VRKAVNALLRVAFFACELSADCAAEPIGMRVMGQRSQAFEVASVGIALPLLSGLLW